MKKYTLEIKWALLFVVISLVWMFLEKVSGLHSTHIDKHAIYTNFFAIPAVAVYVLALRDKRRNYYGGVMTYRQGFVCGVIITAIVTVLSPLTQLVTLKVITPDYFQNAITYSVSSGYLAQQEAEKYFSLANYIVQGTVGALVMGILTSAVVALFTRSRQ